MTNRIEKIIKETGAVDSSDLREALTTTLEELDAIYHRSFLDNLPAAYILNLVVLKQLKDTSAELITCLMLSYALDTKKEHRESVHHALRINHFYLDQTQPTTTH